MTVVTGATRRHLTSLPGGSSSQTRDDAEQIRCSVWASAAEAFEAGAANPLLDPVDRYEFRLLADNFRIAAGQLPSSLVAPVEPTP